MSKIKQIFIKKEKKVNLPHNKEYNKEIKKIYKKEELNISEYVKKKVKEEALKHAEDVRKSYMYNYTSDSTKKNINKLMFKGEDRIAKFIFEHSYDEILANNSKVLEEFKGLPLANKR